MYPILFRVGHHVVSSYTVALTVGMLVGAWVAWQMARGRMSAPDDVLDAGLWGLVFGVVGGRVGYVIANWAYYGDHLDKAWRVWEGGLSWHGALIAGVLGVGAWWWTIGSRRAADDDWRDLFDVLAPGLAAGCAFGWLGCLLIGCAYGAEASGCAPPLSWLTADLPDIYGVSEVRFFTQPLMIAWSLLILAILWFAHRRLRPGMAFAFYLFLYALGDLSVAFLRGDGTWRYGLWLSQWMALIEMVAAIVWGSVKVRNLQAGS